MHVFVVESLTRDNLSIRRIVGGSTTNQTCNHPTVDMSTIDWLVGLATNQHTYHVGISGPGAHSVGDGIDIRCRDSCQTNTYVTHVCIYNIQYHIVIYIG